MAKHENFMTFGANFDFTYNYVDIIYILRKNYEDISRREVLFPATVTNFVIRL